MGIKICIIDPANTDPKELGLIVDMVNYFIANNRYSGSDASRLLAVSADRPIATEDNPSAGHEVVSPQAAFAPAEGNPAAAFGDSNPAAAFAPEAATGNGQAVAAPSLPQNGTPPAPNNGGSMVGGSVELDKNGLPWDARIHAKAAGGGGTKNADGTWRTKRGVDPALVATVSEELRRVMALPGTRDPAPFVGNAIPSIPPAPPAPPAPSPGDVFLIGVPSVPNAPVGYQEPATPPAPPAPAAAAPVANFLDLATKIGGAVAAGKLTQTEIVSACNTFGLADLTQLPLRPELVGNVNMMVDQFIAAKG